MSAGWSIDNGAPLVSAQRGYGAAWSYIDGTDQHGLFL